MSTMGSVAPADDRDGLIRRVLEALRKEYVLVGRRRVQSWHAWFAIGIAAGIALTAVLIASRSGIVPSEAARRPLALKRQAKRFAPLPRNVSPFRYRSAASAREQTFSGGVIRSIGSNALQIDAIVYDAAVSGWREKSVSIPYASIRAIYSLEIPMNGSQLRGSLKKREIKRSELAPGMRIGMVRFGDKVDINVLPAASVARP